MLKRYVYSILLIGMITSQSVAIEASSAPMLTYNTTFIVTGALSTLCITSFFWSWWTAHKVSLIDKSLELVAVDVKDVQNKINGVDQRVRAVQKTQDEHTNNLQGLASGQGLIRSDIRTLKAVAETGVKKLTESLDMTRGSLESRLDKLTQEIAIIKAMLISSNNDHGLSEANEAETSNLNKFAIYQPLFPATTKQ